MQPGRLSRRIQRSARWQGDEDEDKRLFTEENCCPYCFSTAFQIVSATEVKCAFCAVTSGKIVPSDDGFRLDFEGWSMEETIRSREKHRTENIVPTGGTFLKRRDEIFALRDAFREQHIDIPWLVPPSKKGS